MSLIDWTKIGDLETASAALFAAALNDNPAVDGMLRAVARGQRQGSAGAVSFGSSGQFGNFAPGETLAELFLFAGGSLTRTHLDAVASSGSLTVNRVYGTGATALYVADDQDAGLALDADVASAGSSSHGLTTTTGLAGSLIDFDDSQAAAVDTASWTAPDRSSGSIDNLMTPTSGCGIGEPAFAGGPGHWTWSWKGASQQLGELGVAAWAPIGSYWHRFRTPAGGTGVCLPPVFVPVAHSSRS
ncbi:MAG: hypothetical protein ACTHK4_15760, partial [Mycobacteriales bacterium]